MIRCQLADHFHVKLAGVFYFIDMRYRHVYILQDGHMAHTQYTYTHFVIISLSRLAREIMTKLDPIWRPS